jgi:hypothetical protein
MAQEGERYRESRDIWNDYNARQEFEHELIDRKTTWWLTTQSILFAAYGLTVNDGATFRRVIAYVGVATAIVTLFGVLFIIVSKFLSWRRYSKFYRTSPMYSPPRPLHEKPLAWGVHSFNTVLTLVPDILLPLIFAVAWWYVLAL